MRTWFNRGDSSRAAAVRRRHRGAGGQAAEVVVMADGDTYCQSCARATYGGRAENSGKDVSRWNDGWDNPVWVVPADHVWPHRVFCAGCGREMTVRVRRGA